MVNEARQAICRVIIVGRMVSILQIAPDDTARFIISVLRHCLAGDLRPLERDRIAIRIERRGAVESDRSRRHADLIRAGVGHWRVIACPDTPRQ